MGDCGGAVIRWNGLLHMGYPGLNSRFGGRGKGGLTARLHQVSSGLFTQVVGWQVCIASMGGVIAN